MAPGDYYNQNGEYLGNDGKDDHKVYVANSVEKNKDGVVTSADGAQDLGVTQEDFATSANVVKYESSGDATESLWIAHTANNAKDNNDIDWRNQNNSLKDQLPDSEYSTTPASARTPLETSDNSNRANNARAAVIDVLTGGADPTHGAVLWDGNDFLQRGASHNKFNEYTTVTINSDHLRDHALTPKRPGASIDGAFWVPIVFKTGFAGPGNCDRNFSLQSTGAKGYSIFWKLGPK